MSKTKQTETKASAPAEVAQTEHHCPKCAQHFSTCICEEAPQKVYTNWQQFEDALRKASQHSSDDWQQGVDYYIKWKEARAAFNALHGERNGLSTQNVNFRTDNLRLRDENRKLKANAEKLAEALKDMQNALQLALENAPKTQVTTGIAFAIVGATEKANTALADWQKGAQQ